MSYEHNSSSSTHKTHLKSNAVESHILHSTSYVAAYIQCSALYILCCISFIASYKVCSRMSYILHPKSSTPHLKSMHWGKHSVQHSTLCIIHSTSYIATYILFPDVQHSAMSFVLHSKYSLLSVRCITPYILDLTVHLTSYILCSASHFLPCDIHPGSDTDERKVLYHTLYGHFICLNPISDIINSSPYRLSIVHLPSLILWVTTYILLSIHYILCFILQPEICLHPLAYFLHLHEVSRM